jgi:hypothetical protein
VGARSCCLGRRPDWARLCSRATQDHRRSLSRERVRRPLGKKWRRATSPTKRGDGPPEQFGTADASTSPERGKRAFLLGLRTARSPPARRHREGRPWLKRHGCGPVTLEEERYHLHGCKRPLIRGALSRRGLPRVQRKIRSPVGKRKSPPSSDFVGGRTWDRNRARADSLGGTEGHSSGSLQGKVGPRRTTTNDPPEAARAP